MLGDELGSTSRATLTGRAMTGATAEPAEVPATIEAVTAAIDKAAPGTGDAAAGAAAACSALGSPCPWSRRSVSGSGWPPPTVPPVTT